jgi:hypothetical protein
VDFTGAQAKIGRAFHHLESLDADMAAFFGDEPRPIGSKFNAETSEIDLYAIGYEDAPLLDWSLRIGECLHNLRCALDHAAWQFALDHLGRTPTEDEAKKIQFPISETCDGFKGSRIKPLISTVHWDWIDAFQPYHRPDPARTRLALLARLNNIDKHRVVHAAALVPEEVKLELGEPRDIESYESFEVFLGEPIEQGAPVGHFRGVIPNGPHPYIDAKGPVQFSVVFADPAEPVIHRENVIRTLGQLGEVVDAFVSTTEAKFAVTPPA